MLCEKIGGVVVSLQYPRAPQYRFPIAIDAVTEIVKEILADDSLAFDRKKVAIGGFSAGANLALSVVQDKKLQGRIQGVVAFYPPVNISVRAKAGDKGVGGVLPESHLDMFAWGYVASLHPALHIPRLKLVTFGSNLLHHLNFRLFGVLGGKLMTR
jgi:acetyl esterase/lipase